MSRWKKEEQKKNPSRDPIFKAQEVSSATECTGLMPAQIETDEEGMDLADLGAIHPPAAPRDKKDPAP
ncbi:MAG: hypothetical protein IJD39_07110 [Clostridia bacterium]|nr:hypothetical protein [Clostridia bacterium]